MHSPAWAAPHAQSVLLAVALVSSSCQHHSDLPRHWVPCWLLCTDARLCAHHHWWEQISGQRRWETREIIKGPEKFLGTRTFGEQSLLEIHVKDGGPMICIWGSHWGHRDRLSVLCPSILMGHVCSDTMTPLRAFDLHPSPKEELPLDPLSH